MAIREIYQFITANRNKLTREEILAELRNKAYSEDEIEEAFLVDHFTDMRPAARKIAGPAAASSIPTLADLTIDSKRSGAQSVPVPVVHKGQYLVGSLAPLIFYLLGISLFLPQQNYFPPPVPFQLAVSGASAAVAFFLFVWLKRSGSDVGRGLPLGILVMITFSMIFLLIQQLTFFAEVFAF